MVNYDPSRPRRIIVIGDVTTDLVTFVDRPIALDSDTPARIRIVGGGQAANTAAWLAWQRHPVTLLSSVGDDVLGHARRGELSALGVDCSFFFDADHTTGTVVVLSEGPRRSMLTDRGANAALSKAHVEALINTVPDAAHVHLSGYVLLDERSRAAGLRALTAARRRNLTVSVDASSVEPLRAAGTELFLSWLHGVDLLLANEAEAAVLTGGLAADAAGAALTGVARAAVVKCGAAGAMWAGGDGLRLAVPACPVPVTDTTGAGDAFAAGLLSALLDGCQPPAALARAVEFGATATTMVGGSPAGAPSASRAARVAGTGSAG